ncbi:hypothetical protein NP233_g7349 [Leucocoprinus birnbaumii]|uniref:Uncharacterized protein n=1 Tax=Leucocoprinus birnbaumii TaxID=56174 RepID=A0AAD5VUU8_9AGAR|nr:hypothetical protein NP233_g7349 [Leucocoprinus birnbaumii]
MDNSQLEPEVAESSASSTLSIHTPRGNVITSTSYAEKSRRPGQSRFPLLCNSSTDVSQAFRPVLKNASSIQHLSIHVTCTSQLREFLTSEADFNNLESLSLSVQQVDDIDGPITIFRNSPCLNRVIFDLQGCPPSTSLIQLPWSSVQEFEMTGAAMLPSDTFQTLLASCTNLRKASFWIEDPHCDGVPLSSSGASSPSATPTTIPNLTHLSISFYGRRTKTATSLLTGFNLPSLRHFHFFSGFVTLPLLPCVVTHKLESLEVSGVSVPALQFHELAHANPSLRSLTLDLRYFGSNDIVGILGALAQGQPCLFSSMSSLALWTRDVSPHIGDYLRMIRSRGQFSGKGFRFSLYLARRQHGSCCYFSNCTSPSQGNTRLDEVLALADACERTGGVDFYLKDVKPDEGIHRII